MRLLLACSVQICRGGCPHRVGPERQQAPLPRPFSLPFLDHSPPRTLTGHLVMSSGQMWAPLEAGSSQVLEAEIRGGTMRSYGPPPAHHTHPLTCPGGGPDRMLNPSFSQPSWGPP